MRNDVYEVPCGRRVLMTRRRVTVRPEDSFSTAVKEIQRKEQHEYL